MRSISRLWFFLYLGETDKKLSEYLYKFTPHLFGIIGRSVLMILVLFLILVYLLPFWLSLVMCLGMAFLIGSLCLIMYGEVSIYQDKFDIDYPLRLFWKHYSFPREIINRIVFPQHPRGRFPLEARTLFVELKAPSEVGPGPEKHSFSHLFSERQCNEIIAQLKAARYTAESYP
jgi:hypothetical protein